MGWTSNTALREKGQPVCVAAAPQKPCSCGTHITTNCNSHIFSTLKICLSDHMHLRHFYLRDRSYQGSTKMTGHYNSSTGEERRYNLKTAKIEGGSFFVRPMTETARENAVRATLVEQVHGWATLALNHQMEARDCCGSPVIGTLHSATQ